MKILDGFEEFSVKDDVVDMGVDVVICATLTSVI